MANDNYQTTAKLIDTTTAEQLRQERSIRLMESTTRAPYALWKLVDISNRIGDDRFSESINIAMQWEIELMRNGIQPTDSDLNYAVYTIHAWLRPDYIEKPVIIAAPPAFGKSTMLTVFLRHMVNAYPDTFGAVVVKERIVEIESLADDINGQVVAGRKRAYAIRGFDSSKMTREQYEEQFTDQAGCNVVLMTTKQFELQTMRGNLRNFTEFNDAAGKSRPRRLLLVDEKPSLVINHTLTVRELNDFLADVMESGRLLRGSVQPYYKRLLPIVEEIRGKLESPDECPSGKFPSMNASYRLPVQLARDYSAVYGHERMKVMRAFERIVKHGGDYHVYNGVGSITTTQVIHYQYTLFNTFILDGTGSKDPDYNSSDFYLAAPDKMPSYENVTFHVCDTYSLSRTSLDKAPDGLSEIAKMVKRIVAEKQAPTLVVTYLSYVSALEMLLAEEVAPGKVIMKHFDGGRGSNAYISADNAIYIGSLFKGTSYYTTTTQAVVGDRIADEISSGFGVSKAGVEFADQFVNEYRQLDIAVNLVQETNRLRASRKKQPVNIYLFNKDAAMFAHILESYPGAKVTEFEPIEKLTGTKTAIDGIVDYFASMEHGVRVKGSAIYRDLDIHRNTFGGEMKTDKAIRAMKQHGITKEGTFFVKGVS